MPQSGYTLSLCFVIMDLFCISVIVCLIGLAFSDIRMTIPTLTVCRQGDQVKFKCDIGDTVPPDYTSALFVNVFLPVFNSVVDTVEGTSLTKTVPKESVFKPRTKVNSYQCRVKTRGGARSEDSRLKSVTTFDSLSVCRPAPDVADPTCPDGGIACSKFSEKKPTLTVCKKDSFSMSAELICCIDEKLKKGAQAEFDYNDRSVQGFGRNEVKKRCVIRTGATNWTLRKYTCTITQDGKTTKVSNVVQGKFSKDLKVCTEDQLAGNSAPGLVNSLTLALVCLTAAVVKFNY